MVCLCRFSSTQTTVYTIIWVSNHLHRQWISPSIWKKSPTQTQIIYRDNGSKSGFTKKSSTQTNPLTFVLHKLIKEIGFPGEELFLLGVYEIESSSIFPLLPICKVSLINLSTPLYLIRGNLSTVIASFKLSKCHKIYTSVISDQKLYPKEMRQTTYKYKLPLPFSKAKLAWCPLATICYSKVFTVLQIDPH